MSKTGLGKAIQNRLDKKQRAAIGNKAPIFYQETEQNDAEIKKQKMKSVIQQNSLTEFLQTAQLSQQNFKANRDIKFREIKEEIKNRKVIMIDNKMVTIEDDIDQSRLLKLQMPRRPDWKQLENKEELNKLEAEAYLNWRRKLAELEETNNDIKITPYEKNIEVWKQLWRVTERADLMVQIVDGRDPLFFRCEDLVDYVSEINPQKRSLMLINKSDLVPEDVRMRWNKYLNNHKINHIFFSAKLSNKENEEDNDETSQKTNSSEILTENQIIQQHFNKPDIISVTELAELFNQYAKLLKKDKIQVGLAGYPNVGKSSVINALFGQKKVGVASMPGKTKHFQTLMLSEKVTLCDCPGLVFPRISASHAYMVLNGLYPIDTLKSYAEPIRILIQRIPKKVIEDVYCLHWKQNDLYDVDTVLNKYSQLKGFFTGNGVPNQPVAAKNMLKDYVNGVLVYARNPPELEGEEVLESKEECIKDKLQEDSQNKQEYPDMKKQEKKVENELDEEFFKQKGVIVEEYDPVKDLTEEDLLDIMEGKKIGGLKITKQMRSSIKHALKRGQGLETIKKKYLSNLSSDNKKLIKL